MNRRTSGLVLAAGSGTRFGGGKLLARIGGRPILQSVLDALADAGIAEVTVVLGHDAETVGAAIEWRTERRVVNPDPGRGLSSSLQLGFATIDDDVTDVLVALGDQPFTRSAVIAALVEAGADARGALVVPRYADDHGRNPVLIQRAAFPLLASTAGDRGFGPTIASRPELVHEVDVPGTNVDIDSRRDLVEAIEASWAQQVRANRDQVERIREIPDGDDFYAPVRSVFRADPARTDDPILDILLGLRRPGETWLDIGAGAGRFALPIARALDASGGSMVALDSSASMLESLREIAEDHAIDNVATIEARWPPPDPAAIADLEADVALIAHVGYDIEAIGPFIDALEAVARRACVAVLMERVPAAAANGFWPLVHDQDRVALPALGDLLELLEARGRRPSLERVDVDPRRFETRAALEGFVRRQLWIDPTGPKESRFQAVLQDLAIPDGEGWAILGRQPSPVGVVIWDPR